MARRSTRRRSRTSRALRWLAAGSLLAISLAYVGPLKAYLHARRDVSARTAEVARLEARKARLERRLEAAGTDVFVEREARKLGLVRPGERLFIVKGLRERPRLR